MAENCEAWWWARQGLNLRPLRCERKAYRRKARKSAKSIGPPRGTRREQTTISRQFHRSFTGAVTRLRPLTPPSPPPVENKGFPFPGLGEGRLLSAQKLQRFSHG